MPPRPSGLSSGYVNIQLQHISNQLRGREHVPYFWKGHGGWTSSYLPRVAMSPGALLLSSLWALATAKFLSLQLLTQPLPKELAGLPQCLPLGS